MPVLPALYGFLTADNYGLRVGIPLRHRSGAGVKSEDGDDGNDDEEDEPLRAVVTIHDEPLSSSERNCSCFTKKHCSTPGWRVSKTRFYDAI